MSTRGGVRGRGRGRGRDRGHTRGERASQPASPVPVLPCILDQARSLRHDVVAIQEEVLTRVGIPHAPIAGPQTTALGLIPIPPLSLKESGGGVVLEGQGPETVWDASLQPLTADPTAANVTLRRATLRNALLVAPTSTVPIALVTNGAYVGPWFLEDLTIYVSSCNDFEVFANMTCDLQPAAWIRSNGWSVTVGFFSGGGFTSSNVTIACDPTTSFNVSATAGAATTFPNSSSTAAARPPACVTLTAGSPDELLSILSYTAVHPSGNGSIVFPPAPSRLHVTLTANVSLDPKAWLARRPVLTRPLTTISSVDCRLLTAINLNGGISLISVEGGAVLRLLCLELSNLATDTLGKNMPRSLLTAAVWAVDVDIPKRSRLILENTTLVLTKDEFKWQSYYMAQALTNSAVYGNITTVLASFQGIALPSQLLWVKVASPHTLWLNAILTIVPHVYNTTVPNSFIMRYLGLSIYLTDLLMVYSCNDLLNAVRNCSVANGCVAATGGGVVPAPSPRVLVLGANISIGPCWPPGGVSVAFPGSSLMVMGLPDVATTLDLAGRSDVFDLLLLDNVSIVVPAVELEQYDKMRSGNGAVMPYFSPLSVYIGASSLSAVQPSVSAPSYNTSSTAGDSDPRVLASLAFDLLLLPGLRGADITFLVWAGQYGNWSAAAYDAVGGNGSGGGGAAASSGSSGLRGWRAAVLAAMLGLAIVAAAVAAVVLSVKHSRALHGVKSAKGKQRGDLEAGEVIKTEPTAALCRTGGGGGDNAGGDATAGAEPRRPLYDSFDDPAFELDLVRGAKLSSDDVADILDRVNAEAAEFNIVMTEICGSGAFGVVYGGTWHGLKVAIKTMVFSESAPALVAGHAARQQCIREAAFCCTMHHPNVVATHHYYLRSTKRHTMFDDILQQQTEDSTSEEHQDRRGGGHRTSPLLPFPLAEALRTTASQSPGHGAAAAGKAGAADPAAVAADEGCRAENPPGAAAGTTAAGTTAPVARVIGPARRSFDKRGGLPRYRPTLTKTAITDWRLYLIQEYCDGGTLRQAVDQGKLFRHSGMECRPRDKSSGGGLARSPAACRGGDGGGDGGGNGRRTAAAAEHADSLDEVQTLMIIGRQGRLVRDEFPGMTNVGGTTENDGAATVAVPYTSAGGGGADAADAAVDTAAPTVELLSLVENGSIANNKAAEPSEAAVAAVVETPTGAPQTDLECPHSPLTATLDSNIIGTTVTNATAYSTICASTLISSGCGTLGDVHCLPPPPSLPDVLPAAAAAAATVAAQPRPAEPALAPDEALPADLFLVIHTALGIASGVAYLHSRNIIHGDLSANNVLLLKTKNENIPVVAKLSDFGLSMRLEHGQDHLKNVSALSLLFRPVHVHVHVHAHALVFCTCTYRAKCIARYSTLAAAAAAAIAHARVHHGTPYYQSPEVAEHGTCSLAADVYSLGVLLWELYHGTPPWRLKKHKARKPAKLPANGDGAAVSAAAEAAAADGNRGVTAKAIDGDQWNDRLRACDVLEISPSCPERYARVLRRCLSPNPRDRPSARAVVKALLRMERSQAAAAVGDKLRMDAALLLEDFDAAAAAVAAAVARVTAAPTVAGAPASAGAAAAVAAAAAAGTASGSLLPVLDQSLQLGTTAEATAAVAR
ncbi:hypothetical protein VOLCADRAFT_119188 [Volvox carteri f. nagariensis]|uniref:Protein kinase domain-containing protein n=1 Tax=Volvox carteri f. nagariensis TaxID=3068 RepID=D8UAW6_VOLCA|nr:uncharacterized protein VOLCADRAFT_119188 [Volvox carteri f. nagariensis]EFJ43173.1 hypothetical protein VOLCADRAFT_119188 [Volvox carteri f. nagariensis]|eukprot:XP_002955748.1 hypothetical protein VOLCADRAFT_119188 [Volvox carteri f. nagariensis]